MRVAVTGGSGKIGARLCQALAARGDDVINLDRRAPRTPAGRFVYCDLRRRELVQPIFEQVDAVCLLGEIPSPRVGVAPEEIYTTNTAIASTVLQTAADMKVKRIIYTSSCQAYGQWEWPVVPPPKLPMDETSPLMPQNVYALSKQGSEGYARMLAREQPGLSIAIFRFPWVVEDSMHPRWLARAASEPDEWMDGFGTYVHLTDAVRAYLLALDRPRPGCEAYHFTAANVRYHKPLREVLARLHPDFPPLPPDWPDLKSPVSLEKAKSHLGWEPQWDLHEFLARQPDADRLNSQ